MRSAISDGSPAKQAGQVFCHQYLMLQALAEAPLVQAGLLPAGFIDSCALNLYHDGSEGIQPHMVRCPTLIPDICLWAWHWSCTLSIHA